MKDSSFDHEIVDDEIIARGIELPPKAVKSSFMVNQYPNALIDEVLRREGLLDAA